MHRWVAIIVVVCAVVIEGAVSGIWTQRWATATSLEAIANAAQLPAVAGDWDGRDEPVAASELRTSQATAIARRTYVHRGNGTLVSVMLVAGRGGPVAVHTPEVCFPSNGYESDGKRSHFRLNGDNPAEFWHSRFAKQTAGAIPLSVYYSWNDGGRWQATEKPRLAFADRAALFKLYVVIERSAGVDSEVDDAARDLIRAILPHLAIPK